MNNQSLFCIFSLKSVRFFILVLIFGLNSCALHKVDVRNNQFTERSKGNVFVFKQFPVRLVFHPLNLQEINTRFFNFPRELHKSINAYEHYKELKENGLFPVNLASRITMEVTPQVLANDSARFSNFTFILTLGVLPAIDETFLNVEFKFIDSTENKVIHKVNYMIRNKIYLTWFALPFGSILEAMNDKFAHTVGKHNGNMMKNVLRQFRKDMSWKLSNDKEFANRFTTNKDYSNSFYLVPFRIEDERDDLLGDWMFNEILFFIRKKSEDIKNESNVLREYPKDSFLTYSRESSLLINEEVKADKLIFVGHKKNSLGSIIGIRMTVVDTQTYKLVLDKNYPIVEEDRNNLRRRYLISAIAPFLNDLQLLGEL